ncbi:Uncharacterised protein [uncultured archaeon]|nr:Uncharacterised protein [uncultured archaeon]
MIKRLALAVIVLILSMSMSFASGPQGIHEPGTGLANPDTKEAGQGTGQGLQANNETNVAASNPGIHEPGTGIANPEVKEAASGTGQGNQAQAGQTANEPAASAQKTQPGFEVVFALTGLIAIAFIALKRRN